MPLDSGERAPPRLEPNSTLWQSWLAESADNDHAQRTMASPTTVLHFVTGNANKLAEVRAILEQPASSSSSSSVPLPITVTSRSIDLLEIQAASKEEVTLDKCRRAVEIIQGPVLVEDTCLCFNALNGLPGPYIKWFMTSLGHDGLNKLLAGHEDKSAQAVCTFALSKGPGHEPMLFQGVTDGKIVPARGPANFGWDPIFEYEGKTYAEMDKEQKNTISHRYKALQKLREYLAAEMA
ncbi:non-canonical purine NTP pyrophosphatase [Grosmannia clavigera kw1407]|uniref:Inosine triphosphate pyrophosphatase n=1 Tax=Grosmannia clavigera (strain kw1407 / UAMH 11150) TaxID=655863 RepID=F0XM29_GROCL|nr:non-canonical purine NTP pyrophosphatase [Grosmannia clavigera kw1407]EFX01172.1 non-canonical purine NTP pyrophosphatase [Grosmannia clavigera kw1407]